MLAGKDKKAFDPSPAGQALSADSKSSHRISIGKSLWRLPRRERRDGSDATPQDNAGAGEGNRTLVCSLGSCRSTI